MSIGIILGVKLMENPMTAAKVHEARVRRKLARMGVRLEKSHARDPDHITYGTYQILRGNLIVHRGLDDGFGLSLPEVIEWIETHTTANGPVPADGGTPSFFIFDRPTKEKTR
ncbi:MAG TPA: hypothetical protein VNV63_07860 [Nitrospiria bacterium]|nr:hypothetical protein [Nitrospiria bacterium]